MDFEKLSNNQKRVLKLLYNNKGEYWIQKQTSTNKQGFLWKLHYYDDDNSPYKINNWTVNSLIKKGWLKEWYDSSASLYGLEYALLTDVADNILCFHGMGLNYLN